MKRIASQLSDSINKFVEVVIVILMATLVLDVWLGVMDRYLFHWQLPWPEVIARYLMIWAAMLAVSSGISRREHIGLTSFIGILPRVARKIILILVDIICLALFLYVFYYGIGFASGGGNRDAQIFGLSMLPFFAAIPVAAGISSLQLFLVLLRDAGDQLDTTTHEEFGS
jgi:TRAP-type C4-dicarboxylate transport system permease small subunit